jgi:ferredoxin
MSEKTNEKYRVSVDFIACRGHGMCADFLPDNFSLDEWGYPIVRDETLAPVRLSEAKSAALLCPELALRVEKVKEKAGVAQTGSVRAPDGGPEPR